MFHISAGDMRAYFSENEKKIRHVPENSRFNLEKVLRKSFTRLKEKVGELIFVYARTHKKRLAPF